MSCFCVSKRDLTPHTYSYSIECLFQKGGGVSSHNHHHPPVPPPFSISFPLLFVLLKKNFFLFYPFLVGGGGKCIANMSTLSTSPSTFLLLLNLSPLFPLSTQFSKPSIASFYIKYLYPPSTFFFFEPPLFSSSTLPSSPPLYAPNLKKKIFEGVCRMIVRYCKARGPGAGGRNELEVFK